MSDGTFRYTCVKCGIGTNSAYVLRPEGIAWCILCGPPQLTLVRVDQPASPDPLGTVVMTCGPGGCRVQRVGE